MRFRCCESVIFKLISREFRDSVVTGWSAEVEERSLGSMRVPLYRVYLRQGYDDYGRTGTHGRLAEVPPTAYPIQSAVARVWSRARMIATRSRSPTTWLDLTWIQKFWDMPWACTVQSDCVLRHTARSVSPEAGAVAQSQCGIRTQPIVNPFLCGVKGNTTPSRFLPVVTTTYFLVGMRRGTGELTMLPYALCRHQVVRKIASKITWGKNYGPPLQIFSPTGHPGEKLRKIY